MTKNELIKIALARDLSIDIPEQIDARLISEEPGIHSAFALIKELEIRIASAHKSQIVVSGSNQIIDALSKLQPDTHVHSYTIKFDNQAIVLYLTKNNSLIGSIKIKKPKPKTDA